MDEKVKKRICLVSPSFTAGGAERVLSLLANNFATRGIEVHLIVLIGGTLFYKLDKKVVVHSPSFNYKQFNRVVFTIKILHFVRSSIKRIKPDLLLSFGGNYNSFVLFASFGLRVKTFISDRSSPLKSYGTLTNFINRFMYRTADGIISQTEDAKKLMYAKTKHRNIEVIGNPIQQISQDVAVKKENIILNVGRFISTKHQNLLMDYFNDLDLDDWKLVFLGTGPKLDSQIAYAKSKRRSDAIIFEGEVDAIDVFYNKAKIFAFTSSSEGFPNALGEAMSVGLACLSFDCVAGPKDIIDHDKNGYLVDEFDHDAYKGYLKELTSDDQQRTFLGNNARLKMKKYETDSISTLYLNFMLK